MKKIFSYLYILPAAGVLLLASCSKKIDEAYKNPNAPVKVPVEEILPGLLANMVTQYSNAGNGYGPQNDGLYVGRYVQFWATNANNNQYDQMGGATAASDVLGAIWAMHYYGMGINLVDMVKWGTEEEKWDYVGVGHAIRAWAWLSLTDMHGEAILRQAYDRDRRVFEYDTQESIYAEVKRLCYLALENLNRAGTGISTELAKGDQYMNGGDINKWKKFVNAVMANVHHRITNKTNYNADSVIYYCNNAMLTNAENTDYSWSNAGGAGTYNYYSPFRGNVGTLRQTRFIANLMSGENTAFSNGPAVVDPRAWYIIRENKNGTFKGIIPTRGDSATYPTNFDLAPLDRPFNFWGQEYRISTAPANDATSRYIFTNNPIWPIYTAAQMKFMKAEAQYKKGLKADALTSYTQGINLNFDQLISDYESRVPTANRITTASRNAYITSVTPPVANFTLSHIMLQKYIALYGWGLVDTWVDMRRYHYTDKEAANGLQVYRDLIPPAGTEIFPANNGQWVYRARPRYNSEYLYNVVELDRIGALAADYNTKKMWFTEP